MNDTAAEQWARREITTRTLADLDYKLEIRCRSCGHETLADPHELRRMFPTAPLLPEAIKRLRCKGCGAKDPQTWIWVMGWTRDKRRSR
jgi:DNA-directed RNA polymerase subunit RPC12/RpoP